MADRGNVYVRRRGTREIVYTIPVSARCSERAYDRFLSALVRQTDTGQFFVDDAEIDFAAPSPAADTGGQAP